MKKLIKLTLTVGLLSAVSVMAKPLGNNGVFGDSPNWSKAYNNDSIRFVYIRATWGITNQDTKVVSKMNGAQAAGILAGAIDRCNPSTDYPELEAGYFWNLVEPAYQNFQYNHGMGNLLSPALDVEDEVTGSGGYNGGSSQITLTQWCNRWFGYVQADAAADGIAIQQVTYINAGAAGDLDSSIGGWSWIANPPSSQGGTGSGNPQTGNPWDPCGNYENPWGDCSRWRIWQYLWQQKVDYTSDKLDCDVANTPDAVTLWDDIGAKLSN